MKRAISFVIILICAVAIASAQNNVTPNKPYTVLATEPGFITINELHFGFGLGDTSIPYSKSFFGFTTINGYQIDKNFVVAGGTGLSFYNGGLLVPLFLDLRYRVDLDPLTPYIFGDGGLLLNFSDINNTRLFINPGFGGRYTFTRNIAVNLSTGFLLQQGGSSRDTFINFKAGMTYKF